jgi:uncharacterized membrane protein YcaP (DUF421 family)
MGAIFFDDIQPRISLIFTHFHEFISEFVKMSEIRVLFLNSKITLKMEKYVQIVIQCAVIYFFMMLAIRIFGKKELSQLNTADIILILLISNSVQNAMVAGDESLQGGIIAALSLFLLNFIVKKLMYNYKPVRDFIQTKPEVLIYEGKIMVSNLSKISMTMEELEEALREHGVEHYTHVKLAMLEMDGNISVIPQQENLKQTHHKRKNPKNLRIKK